MHWFAKWRRLRTDAIFRIWISHMLVFALALMICLFGFQRALSIVEQSIQRENRNLLQQGVIETETTLENIYRLALEVSNAPAVVQASTAVPADNTTRYQVLKGAVDAIALTGSYYDPAINQRGFLCLPGLGRILYAGAAYQPEVFQAYMDKWCIAAGEWEAVWGARHAMPALLPLDCGSALYLFPCQQGSASMVFLLDEALLRNEMPFLSEYSAYTLVVCNSDGRQLLAVDGLDYADVLLERWRQTPSLSALDGHLVLHVAASGSGREYLLMLPQQEAMLGLQRLQATLLLLLLAALMLESLLTFFFALRNGKPVNAIASVLYQEDDSSAYSTDLRLLKERISQELEEKRQDRPALQTNFFHELLKASFVSNAEMQYQARRAGLKLDSSSYCAAAMRLFPQTDLSGIDGQTVATANALQELVAQKLQALYPGKFWSYRHNVVVSLYIFESSGPDSWDKLYQALTETVAWLQTESDLQVCWGVGTPCNDLLQFWKSAEEANAMLEMEGLNSSVRLYIDAPSEHDPYYLPYSLEDALVQGLRTGNLNEVTKSMEQIETENLARRTLTANQLQRLNNRISGILRDQIARLSHNEALLHMTDDLDAAYQDGNAEYFIQAAYLCQVICQRTAQEKKTLRSDRINAILNYIQTEYGNPELGLTMVGSHFGISESYLSILFKAEIGTNFTEYLEQIRIQAACKLLREGILVADVASQVGYNSVQSFRRAFKRATGVSPSNYRG